MLKRPASPVRLEVEWRPGVIAGIRSVAPARANTAVVAQAVRPIIAIGVSITASHVPMMARLPARAHIDRLRRLVRRLRRDRLVRSGVDRSGSGERQGGK